MCFLETTALPGRKALESSGGGNIVSCDLKLTPLCWAMVVHTAFAWDDLAAMDRIWVFVRKQGVPKVGLPISCVAF